MSDKHNETRSVLWMLAELKRNGQFYYSDWADEFRPGENATSARADRNFHNHLRLFRESALDLLIGDQALELLSKNGRYYLERGINPTKFETFAERHASDFLPLLHGLNLQKTLVPFPATQIEDLLVDGYDLPEGTLHQILYKSTFPWRINPEHIRVYLSALASKTQVFIRPGDGRIACNVTPLLLVNCDGAWHFLGLGKGLLQYNLSRIEALEPTSLKAFPVDWKKLNALKASVQRNFGSNFVTDWETLQAGDELTIRFSGNALRYARERFDPEDHRTGGLWCRVSDEGESVDVTIRAQAWGEALSEVLRWGPDAEAVAPLEFREAWLEAVRKVAKLAGT